MPELSPSAASSPDVGTTLGGKYRVLRRIGEGGMGVVVEAEHLVTGKRVAIKWMHPEVAARPHAIERFMREARATARVRHPNVVDVYDIVHDRDTCFIVMELLDGEPLSFALARGDMPAHVLIRHVLDAMRGVLAAHRQGVIHRDIKPDNILLAVQADRAHSVAKVVDFGISKLTDANGLKLTRTGTTMGTPMYMSYEQLCGVKDIDVRTDVYAFGVVLYEALTGVPPYPAANLPQLVAKLARTVPAPPKQLRPDIPDRLDALIQRAIAKERDQRTSSLDRLIAELEPFAHANAFRVRAAPVSAVMLRLQPSAAEHGESPQLPARDRSNLPTPMETSMPIPAAPRRRDVLKWLVAAGVIATVIAVLTAYRDLAPQSQVDAATGAQEPPRTTESAAKSDVPEDLAPASEAPAPDTKPVVSSGKPDARVSPEPAHVRASAKPSPAPMNTATALPPGVADSTETRVLERPIALPGQAATLGPTRATATRVPLQPSAASAVLPPQPAPAPTAQDPRFRAGRPRTEDF